MKTLKAAAKLKILINLNLYQCKLVLSNGVKIIILLCVTHTCQIDKRTPI